MRFMTMYLIVTRRQLTLQTDAQLMNDIAKKTTVLN